MTQASVLSRAATLACITCVLAAVPTGCSGDNSSPDTGADIDAVTSVDAVTAEADSNVPPGLLPWEPNVASLPGEDGGNPYPETLNFHSGSFTLPGTTMHVPSVHARGYIDAAIASVWRAARDPQVGRDPTSTNAFSILAWNTEPTFEFSFRTDHVVNTIITLEWQVDWDLGVVMGTSDSPTIAAERWAKSGGNSMLSTLEGSLEMIAVDGEPNVTEVDYQYHLEAPLSGAGTIESYLTVIYGRLRDESHNVPLVPDDCNGCPPAPPGY